MKSKLLHYGLSLLTAAAALFGVTGAALNVLAGLFMFSLLSGCETANLASNHHSLKARITYYHRFEDKYGKHTASGVVAHEGITVAAPPQYPFGMQLYFPRLTGVIGSGNFVVQDRGRLIKGDHFDVYVEARNRRDAEHRLRKLGLIEQVTDVLF